MEPRQSRTLVIGAGITEYWYLKHLKKLRGFRYVLKPSLFGDESMQTIQNRISEGLESGATVVCVFDEDVSQWNDTEKRRLTEIHDRYDDDDHVVIASSMPSIEFWLLLHFENTNRYFGTSAKVIEVLRRYIKGFDKKEQFLKNERWVGSLLEAGRMEEAYKRSKVYGKSGGSYTDFWKGVDKFEENK